MPESVASLRKTYKYKLKPTPAPGADAGRYLWACRRLYNTALEQRITSTANAVSRSRATRKKPN